MIIGSHAGYCRGKGDPTAIVAFEKSLADAGRYLVFGMA